jgi:uncharacterized protein (UPF0332 family)
VTRAQHELLSRARRTLLASRLLLENGYLEESLSRSYYSMFYAAKALLAGEGISVSKHSAVIAAFGQRFAHTGKVPPELHRFLRTAQDLRLSGDYNLDYTAAAEEVEQQIARAEQFLKVAESLIAAPPG